MYIRYDFPDYKKCITGIPNSILKHYGAETAGDTLPELDRYLERGQKNVVVLLVDGMGTSIMYKTLEWRSTLQEHMVTKCDSVFPSTTVAATTSVITGLQPCGHAWLGWDNYYKDIDKNVAVFASTVQNTNEPAAEYNVPWTYTPYKSVVDRLNDIGVAAYVSSPFIEPNPDTLQKVLNRVDKLCREPGRKYIYAYWPQPDSVLHEYGCDSEQAKKVTRDIERKIQKFADKMEDTLLIVTADHGLIDTEISRLDDHEEIMDCLERLPTLEPRAANFFVKKGRKRDFVREFKKVYGEHFMLLTKKEVLERHLFGTIAEHEKFRDMLGDYLAVATDEMSLNFTKGETWKAMHGGISANEVKVPVIIYRDRFFLGYDVEEYISEALDRLKRIYPWASHERLDKLYSYAIEETSGKPEFVRYKHWDSKAEREANGWDGELFIQMIVNDQKTHLEFMNDVKEVFDVRPDHGIELRGWYLESFEFRSHVLGGYSAFVQAGDRCTGGSRAFFFPPEIMEGTFEEFLDKNDELLSGAFGLDKEYMMNFKGLKEFLGFDK